MKTMANQYLGLSLFIMLLAFFIILNAISSFEDTKSRPVLNSLIVAFTSRAPVDIVPPGPRAEKSPVQNLGSNLDQLESLFRSQISSAQTRQNRLGTIMYVKVPFDKFREAITLSLSGREAPKVNPLDEQNVDMLPLLVSLLETQGGVPYKMDMILNIADDPAALITAEPEKFRSYNNDVSAIARTVTAAGLPKHQVTSGIQRGEAGMVNLVFRKYEPFNPLASRNITTEGDNTDDADEAAEEAAEDSTKGEPQ